VIEPCGFEAHAVDGLRLHYARTCRLWHARLVAQREGAIALVGPERYRRWIAYLAGVTIGLEQGPQRVFQTVAAKQTVRATWPLPPTRDDLYRTAAEPRPCRGAWGFGLAADFRKSARAAPLHQQSVVAAGAEPGAGAAQPESPHSTRDTEKHLSLVTCRTQGVQSRCFTPISELG
jgi:hypothetical protein